MTPDSLCYPIELKRILAIFSRAIKERLVLFLNKILYFRIKVLLLLLSSQTNLYDHILCQILVTVLLRTNNRELPLFNFAQDKTPYADSMVVMLTAYINYLSSLNHRT